MIATRRLALISAAGFVLTAAGLTLPASVGSAAELAAAPLLSYDLSSIVEPQVQPAVATQQPAPQAAAASNTDAQPETAQTAQNDAADTIDAASLECMAKVVNHEAGNQKRKGQIAVAQTLVNRLKAGRFGDSICAVANQPGQYFDTASYNPPRDTAQWAEAVDVSRAVLSGNAEVVAPGAMFFRASYSSTNRFFRTRQRVTTVGAHVFYR